MPYKRKKTYDVKLKKEDKELLETQAKRKKLDQIEIVGHLIGLNEKYDLMSGDWEDRLVADDQKRVDYKLLDGSCEAFVRTDKMNFCVWGQDGKPPLIKRLGKETDQALEICAKCVKTKEMKDRLVTLEMRLAKGMVYDVPSCKMGGQLSNDGKKIYCKDPKKAAQYRDVKKFCKIVNRGANCEYLTWVKIAVKGKKPDLDEKSR